MNPQDNKTTTVSILVCAYNHGKYIGKCIEGILQQSFEHFELIILNDGSTDNTDEIVRSFNDRRIRYIKNENNSGSIGKIRNQAVSCARGDYIFFTDSDCIPKFDWIERGLSEFKREKVFAVEGKLIYHKEGYRPALSERKVSNESGGMWMNANMAFRREIFEEFNYDPTMRRQEDRELAIRVRRKYKIPFAPSCIVYHQIIKRSVGQYLLEARNICPDEMIRLFKEYGDRNDMFTNKYRIYNPIFLAAFIFPPLILAEIFLGRVRSWSDVILLPFVWLKSAYVRFLVWKAAIKHRVFVL
ncbi:MAG: glycosyltransferase family 2 protein [Candidatus Zixiibacteriota bacterium]|nr:MAG: glycosyltransferase family 2 protein [candidate division Zixibacteria bacterium]